MNAYQTVVYHDEPDEAAVDTNVLGSSYTTADQAIAAARAAFAKGYWNSATVERGIYHPGEPGIEPDWFEDAGRYAYLGPDWLDLESPREEQAR